MTSQTGYLTFTIQRHIRLSVPICTYAHRMAKSGIVVMAPTLSARLVNVAMQGTDCLVFAVIGLGVQLMAVATGLQKMMRIIAR